VTVKRFGENMRSSKVSDFSAAEFEALRIDSNRIDVLRIMVAWKPGRNMCVWYRDSTDSSHSK